MSRARPLLLVIFTSVGFGVVNTALVWVLVHQLGYLWRDGMLDSPGRRWALAAAGRGCGCPKLCTQVVTCWFLVSGSPA